MTAVQYDVGRQPVGVLVRAVQGRDGCAVDGVDMQDKAQFECAGIELAGPIAFETRQRRFACGGSRGRISGETDSRRENSKQHREVAGDLFHAHREPAVRSRYDAPVALNLK